MGAEEGLVEREGAWALIERVLQGARSGAGGALVLEGAPGEGKTSLLRQMCGEPAGPFQVRLAQGSELEQSLAWGVARQLLAGPARTAVDTVLPAAGSALGLDHGASTDDPVAVCYALTELCSDLAERLPLLIVVDDVHWADASSVRWLAHLAARTGDMAVAAIVAGRPRDPRRPPELTVLGAQDGVVVHQLSPLSADGTAALVRRSIPEADRELCLACHDASGGNAFLVVELARELGARGEVPTPSAIDEVAIDRIDRVVARRLLGAGSEAEVLARAAAVCGAHAAPADVATVAGLDDRSAPAAAEALRGVGLLEPTSEALAFAHPLLRSAVERSIPAGERARLHLAAARQLEREGEPVERVAGHLLMAEPGNDPWVRERLAEAGDLAAASGAPRQAVGMYQRAAAERVGQDAALLVSLGRAAMGVDPAAAEAPLRAALRLIADPEERVPIALDLAVVLQSLRRFGDCVDLLDSLGRELDAAGAARGCRLRVEAELLAQSFFDLASREPRATRLERAASEIRGDDDEEALVLVQLGIKAINTGNADEVRHLAERAWAGGRLLELVGSPVSPSVQWIAYLHLYVDEPGWSLGVADNWFALAQTRGSTVMACFAETTRAESLHRMGSLRDARGAAESAWGMARELGRDFPGWWIALGALGQALVATGEPAEALALLESQGVMDGPPPEIMLLPCPRVVRAECLAAAGQLEQGVNELLQALAWLDEQQEPSPGAWHFPATLVDGLLALGRRDEAAERAGAWLGRTSAFGANTTTGMAQRAVALCRAGDERLDGLKVAEATLSQCPSQFEHARALVELGAALRRAGRRLDAREPLRRGLDLASRCGAKALAGRAQEELVAAGARPRRVALTGVEALSPSELRVAQLAAQGFTNRQVATALFLSRKTVEHHLGSIYTKLGTNDRRRLKVLIGQPSPA